MGWRRLPNLVSGLALVALSAWMYSFAADIALDTRSFKPVTIDVSAPSLVRRIEWRHSVAFWLVLASVALVLGLIALAVTAGRPRSAGRRA